MLDAFPLVIAIVVTYRAFYFPHFLTNFSLLASEKNSSFENWWKKLSVIVKQSLKPPKVWQSTMSSESKNANLGNIDSCSENGLFAYPSPCRRLKQGHEGSLTCCPLMEHFH